MTSLNEACFLPPDLARFQAIAQGFSGRAGACNGGIFNPRRVHLRAGQRLYRFCDSKRAARDLEGEACGGWWLEYEVFSRLVDFARDNSHIQEYAGRFGQNALSYAAKLFLAVPYELGDSGVVVTVDLVRQLDAFRGVGNDYRLGGSDPRDGAADYRPLPGREIWQLCIPAFREHYADACVNLRRWHPGQFLHSHRLS